jgi:hypothetical protein
VESLRRHDEGGKLKRGIIMFSPHCCCGKTWGLKNTRLAVWHLNSGLPNQEENQVSNYTEYPVFSLKAQTVIIGRHEKK